MRLRFGKSAILPQFLWESTVTISYAARAVFSKFGANLRGCIEATRDVFRHSHDFVHDFPRAEKRTRVVITITVAMMMLPKAESSRR